MKAIEYSKALYKIAKYDIMEKLRSMPLEYEQTVKDATDQIKEKGFIVFENYYTNEQCDKMREEVDRLHNTYKEKIWNDNLKADKRLFGGDRKSDLINAFYEDAFINRIRNLYYKTTDVVGCTLAARIDAVKENLGSGGGWHRDSIYGVQLKSFLYLTDVSERHGPFEYVSHTHSQSAKLAAIKKCGVKADQNRLNPEIIEHLLKEEDYNLITFAAKKGTLFIVDTTGIHRGKPIEEAFRYALTNYWYANKIPAHVEEVIIK